jgi:hypothetical protein
MTEMSGKQGYHQSYELGVLACIAIRNSHTDGSDLLENAKYLIKSSYVNEDQFRNGFLREASNRNVLSPEEELSKAIITMEIVFKDIDNHQKLLIAVLDEIGITHQEYDTHNDSAVIVELIDHNQNTFDLLFDKDGRYVQED